MTNENDSVQRKSRSDYDMQRCWFAIRGGNPCYTARYDHTPDRWNHPFTEAPPQASQPVTASMEALVQEGYALVTSAIGKPETQYRMDLKEYIQKLEAALRSTPAATEGERCDNNPGKEKCRPMLIENSCLEHPGGRFQPSQPKQR